MAADLRDQLQTAFGTTYVLERELGGGGMSRVFLATETALGRKVAVKVLPPELAEGLSVERFRREVLLAANLQHPAIVPVLAAGVAARLPYYTMPFVDGESLRARLQREHRVPVDGAVRLTREVADALDCAHERGIVHRDIKPENILLSRDRALLADFGIARALNKATGGAPHETLTATGIAIGTPAYMSPEQALGEREVDARSDVYSLACVAYEMLAGEHPFAGPTGLMVARRFTEPPPPLTSRRPDLPAALDAVLARALALDPNKRYATAGEFARALEAVLGFPAGSAATALTQPRGRAWSSRRRMAVVAAALATLVALGGAWWLAGRERGAAGSERKMLAVLPFKNLGRPEDAYFADGVTEEITSRLSSLDGLGVISRTSADQYRGTTKSLRQIARELGVQYVLEGSVRWERAGSGRGRVRVTPQLIRVSDDSHLWAEPLDADVTDVFQVQGTIAERVAGALDVALHEPVRHALAARPTESFEAYGAYLHGRSLVDRLQTTAVPTDSLELIIAAARRHFERAVVLDSSFAIAHAMLGEAEAAAWFYLGRTDERHRDMRAAYERALQLAPESPHVRVLIAGYEVDINADYGRASEHVERAIARAPSHAEAWARRAFIQWQRGDWETALASARRAVELDPRSHKAALAAANAYTQARRYGEADHYQEHLVALLPDEPHSHRSRAAVTGVLVGDTTRGRRLMQGVVRRFGLERATVTSQFWSMLFRFLEPAQRDSLRAVAKPAFQGDTLGYYHWKAELYRALEQPAVARAYYDSARTILLTRGPATADPLGAEWQWLLGVIAAELDRRDEAVRAARRAVDLVPLLKERDVHHFMRVNLARVLARVGDVDAAVSEIEYLLSVPSYISVPALRVDPAWAPLRSNPRFRRLVEGKR